MDATEKTLTLFTTRMRQMILRFDELKKEKTRLEDMLSERDAKIAELEARLAQASMDYESLKMAFLEKRHEIKEESFRLSL